MNVLYALALPKPVSAHPFARICVILGIRHGA